MIYPIAVLGLVALTACSVPGAPTEDLRATAFAAAAAHIRDFAPSDAQIYLQPTDSIRPDELRALSAATGIPIGARADVLVCRVGCHAAEGTVVLVTILAIELPRDDSAEVELELAQYEPEYEFYSQADRIQLVRRGDTWSISRIERVWET